MHSKLYRTLAIQHMKWHWLTDWLTAFAIGLRFPFLGSWTWLVHFLNVHYTLSGYLEVDAHFQCYTADHLSTIICTKINKQPDFIDRQTKLLWRNFSKALHYLYCVVHTIHCLRFWIVLHLFTYGHPTVLSHWI